MATLGVNELSWIHAVFLRWKMFPAATSLLLRDTSSTLTHWGRDKMTVTSQTTLSNTFSWMEMWDFQLKFHWSLFLRVQLTALVQITAWHWPGDNPISKPMMVVWLMHKCVTRPQWVNLKWIWMDGMEPTGDHVSPQKEPVMQRQSFDIYWINS